MSRTYKYFISKKIRMIILLELRFKALSHAHDQRREKSIKKLHKKLKTPRRQMKMKEMNRNNNEVALL